MLPFKTDLALFNESFGGLFLEKKAKSEVMRENKKYNPV